MFSLYALNCLVSLANCIGLVMLLSLHWEEETHLYRFFGCVTVVGSCAIFVASGAGVYRDPQPPQLFFNAGILGMLTCRVAGAIERERVEELMRRRKETL